MTESEKAQVVREMFLEGNRTAETGELGEWLRYFSEDIEWVALEDAPDAGTYRGLDGIRGYFEDWLSTVDGIHWEILELADIGDGVLAHLRFNARVKGTDNAMLFDYFVGV